MDLGIFESDKFSLQELTAAINEAPALPSRLAALGMFQEEGIMTTSLTVEKDMDTLTLIPNQSRTTATPNTTGGSARSVVVFPTTHLPTQDTITPDDVQNMRAFGKASEEETMFDFVQKRLAKMRRRLDATIEYQRVGAVKGTIIDSDGTTVIANLFSAFGLTQQTHTLALATDSTDVRGETLAAKDKMESALGNEPYSGVRVLCGKTFFRALIAHPNVRKAYDLFESGVFLRNDPRYGFELGGCTWEEWRGGIGGTPFVADGEAYLFPDGVDEMFITRFAPANYNETANTIGLPNYAKQEAKPLGKGILVEAQSNPISICTRPRAVIRLQMAA
jgi:hypothetical protein